MSPPLSPLGLLSEACWYRGRCKVVVGAEKDRSYKGRLLEVDMSL